jgi:hypothetical protein
LQTNYNKLPARELPGDPQVSLFLLAIQRGLQEVNRLIQWCWRGSSPLRLTTIIFTTILQY